MNEQELINEIYYSLGIVEIDLHRDEILDAKFTVNHLINKIEMYYRAKEMNKK